MLVTRFSGLQTLSHFSNDYIVVGAKNSVPQFFMNAGRYIFSQIVDFLPKRKFERIMEHRTKNKVEDRTLGWQLSYWGQLLVLIFGQLLGCRSLRELSDITTAHRKKSFHLGFGKKR